MIEVKKGDDVIRFEPGDPARMEALENRVNHLETRLKLLETQETPIVVEPPDPIQPDPSGIVLSPGDSIQDAIDDAKHGENINLHAGRYNDQMYFAAHRRGLTLRPYPGDEGKVVIDGRVRVPVPHWMQGSDGVWSGTYRGFPGLWTRHDKAAAARNYRRLANCRPELVTIGDVPLKPVDKIEDLETNSAFFAGSFFIEGQPAAADRIHVKLKPGYNIEDLEIARFPWLVDAELLNENGTDGAREIAFENLIFKGCSNTTKVGMFNMAGPDWRLNGVKLALSNTINLKLGTSFEGKMRIQGQNLMLFNVLSDLAGQSGIHGSAAHSQIQTFRMTRANWGGFDHRWEAVCKFSQSHHVKISDYEARDCNGVPLWWDIGNHDIEAWNVRLYNSLQRAVLIEHYAERITLRDYEIDGVRKFAGMADGVGIQSNVKHCKVLDGTIKDCEKGFRYKKLEGNDRDKGSGHNTILRHKFENVTQKMYIEGTNEMLDTFDHTTRA